MTVFTSLPIPKELLSHMMGEPLQRTKRWWGQEEGGRGRLGVGGQGGDGASGDAKEIVTGGQKATMGGCPFSNLRCCPSIADQQHTEALQSCVHVLG